MIEQQATDMTGIPIADPVTDTIAAVPGTTTDVQSSRLGKSTFTAIMRNRKALVGVLILIAFGLTAVLAPVISPGDPNELNYRRNLAPSSEHWFGTTGSGQDVFDQTVWGARQSLGVGV